MRPSAPSTDVPEPPQGEHIFNASRLTEVAIRYKEAIKGGPEDQREAAVLLEEVIRGTRSMLERLAQHEKFPNTVDLETLIAAAEARIMHWLDRWDPKKGRLFSYFSGCARHAFLSEIQRTNSYRKRFHATGDNLEQFHGTEDFHLHRREAAEAFRDQLRELTTRWGSPEELGAIRYLVECILEGNRHNRRRAITAVCYAWGLSPELARFFHTWVLFGLRDALYDRHEHKFTEQDLFRHTHSYSLVVDLLDIIDWTQLKRIIATMGGARLKIPTPKQLEKDLENYHLTRDLERSKINPENDDTIAKKYGRSGKSAQQVYEEMTHRLSPDRAGEHFVFGDGEDMI